MKNSVGIELPEYIDGYGSVTPYSGVFTRLHPRKDAGKRTNPVTPGAVKVLPDLDAAIVRSGLKDGITELRSTLVGQIYWKS